MATISRKPTASFRRDVIKSRVVFIQRFPDQLVIPINGGLKIGSCYQVVMGAAQRFLQLGNRQLVIIFDCGNGFTGGTFYVCDGVRKSLIEGFHLVRMSAGPLWGNKRSHLRITIGTASELVPFVEEADGNVDIGLTFHNGHIRFGQNNSRGFALFEQFNGGVKGRVNRVQIGLPG
ncbi:hypothetical protein SDC9_153607 [bioreactor metagenome]|uniref:Uncharacterized protein n=1 Tax=bioreactor metagenome TaxID=1076179 RepID=A0A645EWD9_9ZZZZ